MKNPGLEVRARTNGTCRSEDCALSTQPNLRLQNRGFIGVGASLSKSTQKPQRMLIMDIRRNADRLTLIYAATLSRFGSGPCIRRPAAVQAPEHAAAKRGHHRFFFWSEIKGGSSAPSEPPLATCLKHV